MNNYCRPLFRLLLVLTMGTHFAHADGAKTGGWMIHLGDHWYSLGWCSTGDKAGHFTRSWSGNDTTFTGQGGWFSSTWNTAEANCIPDISKGGPGFGSLTKMVPNYTIQWTGNGDIMPNGSHYTFGLKFNTADFDGYRDYDLTTSYECYIITHTNKTTREGRFMGTVYPEGDPVGYDCYEFTANWHPHGEFKQLWAWRRENTWSGPVNVQAILKFWSDNSGTSFNINEWFINGGFSIMVETFDTSGSFMVENIQIPDLTTLLPAVKNKVPVATPRP